MSDLAILVLGAAPLAGDGPPIWLAEHEGGLLAERLVAACAGLAGRMVFAVREAEMRRFHLAEVLSLAAPGGAVVPVAGDTGGAPCTALLCIDHIAPDGELLIFNSNELLDLDYAEPVRHFRANGWDAGVVSFPSLHPRYSYVRLAGDGSVEEVAEKRPLSRNAIAGFTWFRRGGDFLDGAQAMIVKDAHVDGRFYLSLVLNELILRQRRVGVFPIEARRFRPLKSRRQVELYEAEAAG